MFRPREPLPELLQRWTALACLTCLGVLAIVFGFFFQHNVDLYRHGGIPTPANYRADADRLIVFGEIALLVAWASMLLWSVTAVNNARRVFPSLRSVWVAGAGWLLVPVAALATHQWLDKALDSGWTFGGAVLLLLLYVPHATIAGAAKDLGGTTYLARVWYMLIMLGSIVMAAALSGLSSGLPVSKPLASLQEKAFLCVVGGLLLLAGAASFYATARNLSELVHHRWAQACAPKGSTFAPRGAATVTRAATFVQKRPIPTMGLRLAVAASLVGANAAGVAAILVTRRRAILAGGDDSVAAEPLVAIANRTFGRVVWLLAAVHAVYVVWAICAALNARRRTVMAPSAAVIAASFLVAVVPIAFAARPGNPFGTTAVAIAALCIGFVAGQMMLGRSAVALGGSGRLFLYWLTAETVFGACFAYVGRFARTDKQLDTVGIVLGVCAALSCVLGWLAMSRLDRLCHAEPTTVTAARQASRDDAFTSSHRPSSTFRPAVPMSIPRADAKDSTLSNR